MIVDNRCTPAMVPMDMRTVSVADIGIREPGDQFGGHMAAMLDQVCLDGPPWLVRVMMCVNTMVNPTENEMVGRKTLRLRLSDGTEVLTQQSLGGNALYLAAHSICVLCIAASYALLPIPPAVSSTKGR